MHGYGVQVWIKENERQQSFDMPGFVTVGLEHGWNFLKN